MNTLRIFQVLLVCVLALALFSISASAVLAYDPPWPSGMPWPTTMAWPTARPLRVGESWSPNITAPVAPVIPTPTIALPAKPAASSIPVMVLPNAASSSPAPAVGLPSNPAPKPVPSPAVVVSLPAPNISSNGSTPENPFNAAGTWRALDGGATAWYRIGSGGMQMEVWLDAIPHSNVQMAIYAPGQLNTPVGYGTTYSKDPTRLTWSGGHWNSNGDWLAKVTNGNSTAIQYAVSSSGRDISNKACHSYWEYLPTGPYVLWTICEEVER